MTIKTGGLIRISDQRLGIQADSPALQKDSITYFATKIGHTITEDCWIELWDSASGDTQPAEKAITFCKENKLTHLIVNNIERFTRGGVSWYPKLKEGLTKVGVQLLDAEGIISTEKVNTLEEYGVQYKFSVYDKSEEDEIKRAIDARTGWRRDLTKMIKAELRYASLGYWMYGRPPLGYKLIREDTQNGLRWLVAPHEDESKYIIQIFDLKAEGRMSDEQIVDYINSLGFRTRVQKKRHPDSNKKDIIIGSRGGVKLTVKQMYVYLQKPLYAGVLWESRQQSIDGKMQKMKPKKLAGTPLVSIEKFNQANKGKIQILENDGELLVVRGRIPDHLLFKNVHNDLYPFKQNVLCPECNNPLHASASTGNGGVPRAAYHCYRKIQGQRHSFRVKLSTFNETIEHFVKQVKLTDDTILRLKLAYLKQFEERRNSAFTNKGSIDQLIQEKEAEQLVLIQQGKRVTQPTLLKSIEDDISKIEVDLALLQQQRNKQEKVKGNAQEAINTFWYFLEHLEELIIKTDNPIQTSKLFGLMFDQTPTYTDILVGTCKLACVFELKQDAKFSSEPFMTDLEHLDNYIMRVYTTFQEFNISTEPPYYASI